MALAMVYVNEVMRQFPTTVLVNAEDWPSLMKAFKFDPAMPACTLDRMTFVPVIGGYQGLLARLGEAQAKVAEAEASTPQELAAA